MQGKSHQIDLQNGGIKFSPPCPLAFEFGCDVNAYHLLNVVVCKFDMNMTRLAYKTCITCATNVQTFPHALVVCAVQC